MSFMAQPPHVFEGTHGTVDVGGKHLKKSPKDTFSPGT
jgi:hypothetical protein